MAWPDSRAAGRPQATTARVEQGGPFSFPKGTQSFAEPADSSADSCCTLRDSSNIGSGTTRVGAIARDCGDGGGAAAASSEAAPPASEVAGPVMPILCNARSLRLPTLAAAMPAH